MFVDRVTPPRVLAHLYNFENWPSDHTMTYSGGRYHALLLAYAMARGGADVTVLTNSHTAFGRDCESEMDATVRFIVDEDFRSDAIPGVFDVVVVAPSGAFRPEFYASAEEVAHRTGATLVLINYESANWFNSIAPTPDDPRVWDYWRRTVLHGGVVLSSARESDRWARNFYLPRDKPIVFDHCYPPINSIAADAVGDPEPDGSIVCFARPFHDFKGGNDVLALAPEVLRDRTLHVVFGGTPDRDYRAALEAKVAAVPSCRLEVHSRLRDREKFDLLARAGALLFPSRFEGFGYPPVEATYVGTPVCCYDLPVLVETVGTVAHMAPLGDVDELSAALHRALAEPRDRNRLKASVADIVSIDACSRRTKELLARWCSMPRTAWPFPTVLWGPWSTLPGTFGAPGRYDRFPPQPPWGCVDEHGVGDDISLRVHLWADGPVTRATLLSTDRKIAATRVLTDDSLDGWIRTELEFHLQPADLDRVLALEGVDRTGGVAFEREELLVRHPPA